ncbi:MAG: hypothetical protein CL916_13975 [Deltaproteobacteria bacterium]|nr:hypothetical protein [Deltaproteobacteria bacterium]
MTKEEEWELLAQIHEGEKELLTQAWTIPEVLTHCTQKMDVKNRIRMGELEDYLEERAKKEHPKAIELFAQHQHLEQLRYRIVKQAEGMIPKILEPIIEGAVIALLFEELLDLAEYGLYRSTRVFDYSRGLPYRTYARWTIRALCSRYIDHKMDGEEWFPSETAGRIVFVPA